MAAGDKNKDRCRCQAAAVRDVLFGLERLCNVSALARVSIHVLANVLQATAADSRRPAV